MIMRRIPRLFKEMFIRRHTRVSPFAILHDVRYDNKSTYIGFMAKCERASIGKCTTVGSMAAIYDARVGNFCSIARDVYVGGQAIH